jgi:hypothetical protein
VTLAKKAATAAEERAATAAGECRNSDCHVTNLDSSRISPSD